MTEKSSNSEDKQLKQANLICKSANPWLKIPLEDYLGHMNSKGVLQYQMLREIFRETYNIVTPKTVLFLGGSDGNGMEVIDLDITNSLHFVEINPDYLKSAEKRFADLASITHYYCIDFQEYIPAEGFFEWVHGALFFEYVEIHQALSKIASGMAKNGYFSAVIQNHDNCVEKITPTRYVSLGLLEAIMKPVDPAIFERIASEVGLKLVKKKVLNPIGSKRFHYYLFQKAPSKIS